MRRLCGRTRNELPAERNHRPVASRHGDKTATERFAEQNCQGQSAATNCLAVQPLNLGANRFATSLPNIVPDLAGSRLTDLPNRLAAFRQLVTWLLVARIGTNRWKPPGAMIICHQSVRIKPRPMIRVQRRNRKLVTTVAIAAGPPPALFFGVVFAFLAAGVTRRIAVITRIATGFAR